MDTTEESEIQRWLTGRSVLLTGGTGFVGSVLLEKLLRSCPGLTRVYVLVRGRKGLSSETRMQDTLDTPLFSILSSDAKKKITVVDGDITEPELGLRLETQKMLQDEISVVFHVAASTNFSSSLPQAATINLLGTKHALDFARSCTKVQGFLYVSTAYCNSMVRGTIMETLYPTWIDPIELINLARNNALTEGEVKALLGGHSNTYSFTKQLAEELIRKEHGALPVAIVRPSLVLGCHSEPVIGWLSNVQNGGVAFMAGAGKGVFRTVVGYPEEVADIVPVDMVANMCIAAIWDAIHNSDNKGLLVTHCVSGAQNPVTWGQYCDLVVEAARRNPSQEVIWIPSAKCRANVLRCYLFVYIFQLLPSYFLQSWESLFGYGRPILQYQEKFIRGIQYVRFFTTRSWYFDARASHALEERLSEPDRRIFNFDVRRIKWPSYFESCVLGVRHFYHGDSPSTLKSSRKLIPMLMVMHWAAYIGFFVVASVVLSFCWVPDIIAHTLAFIATAFLYWF